MALDPPVICFPAMALGRDRYCHCASKERILIMKHATLETSKKRFEKSHRHGVPNLRSLRQRKGLSLSQLADMTGIRKDTITHLENGREDPQPYHLRMLARALDVQQPELVS
jgi:DNA-binding XRE family transcriptional regulator